MGVCNFYFCASKVLALRLLASCIFIFVAQIVHCGEEFYPFTSNNLKELTLEEFQNFLTLSQLIKKISFDTEHSKIYIEYTDSYCEKYKMGSQVIRSKYWKLNETISYQSPVKINATQLYNFEILNAKNSSRNIKFCCTIKTHTNSTDDIATFAINTTTIEHYNIAVIKINASEISCILFEESCAPSPLTKLYIKIDNDFCQINTHISTRDTDDMYAL